MNSSPAQELWLVAGSQHLYGPEALRQVDANTQAVAKGLAANANLPVSLVHRPCVTTPEEIRRLCLEANSSDACVGLVLWMHTFSPAKMWIDGLSLLQKPICHLHTQFNRDIPWAEIDMDFMNLNQSAHGGREFGHLCTRLDQARHVIVGHWEEHGVQQQLAAWSRVARGWAELRSLKVVRFGDNMRQVAVTEGDKVEAQRVLGFSVNTHGVGDLVNIIEQISAGQVDDLCHEYAESYEITPELLPKGDRHQSLRTVARIEAGLRAFLEEGGYGAFTDTFEDLHGLEQLPGLPVQRLMADGYGFGAEGDWKHAALVRALKTMASGDDAGTSFMEDYTYHFDPDSMRCLGAHMLEICPSIAAAKPRVEIHPLGIGGKADPVRLVFTGKPGPALNASLVDLGNRFRLLVSEVVAHKPVEDLPKLPVARVLWEVMPDLPTGAAAWIQAGGAHHTAFSYSVSLDQLAILADLAGIECVVIDRQTDLRHFLNELRWNRAAFGLRSLA